MHHAQRESIRVGQDARCDRILQVLCLQRAVRSCMQHRLEHRDQPAAGRAPSVLQWLAPGPSFCPAGARGGSWPAWKGVADGTPPCPWAAAMLWWCWYCAWAATSMLRCCCACACCAAAMLCFICTCMLSNVTDHNTFSGAARDPKLGAAHVCLLNRHMSCFTALRAQDGSAYGPCQIG
jgi:hypothetical protein